MKVPGFPSLQALSVCFAGCVALGNLLGAVLCEDEQWTAGMVRFLRPATRKSGSNASSVKYTELASRRGLCVQCGLLLHFLYLIKQIDFFFHSFWQHIVTRVLCQPESETHLIGSARAQMVYKNCTEIISPSNTVQDTIIQYVKMDYHFFLLLVIDSKGTKLTYLKCGMHLWILTKDCQHQLLIRILS